MRFCKICQRAMERRLQGAGVVFSCPACHATEDGGPEDAHLDGGLAVAEEDPDQHVRAASLAAFDRAALKVERDCPCGMNYMSRRAMGDNYEIWHSCICGRVERGAIVIKHGKTLTKKDEKSSEAGSAAAPAAKSKQA